ncbi:MAG: 50S ribosomal protein L15 [Verrucomicrobiota bacterium]|nr:50S ribosomal protein L15 [Verrucomicrobiota bacterium]
MALHGLQNTAGSMRRRKRVGRGESSGRGKTAGRGNKGQLSRKGSHRRAGFEGGQMRLIRRLPKRGFKSADRKAYLPVNVGALALFDEGAEVTPDTLRAAGLARGRDARIKVLGDGELKKKLCVKAHAFSAGAKSKIEAAGGQCEVVTS